METSSQQDLERKLAGLRNEVQVQIILVIILLVLSFHALMEQRCNLSIVLLFLGTQCVEHTIICLEEQQDEFDFKYQTHKMEGKQTEKFWFNLHAG